MLKTEISSSKISFTFSSDRKLVNHVIGMAEYFIRHNRSFKSKDLNIVLRELLNNAIEHGNRGEKESSIMCSIELKSSEKAVIIVEDDGQGFDYHDLDLSLPTDGSKISNRGLILVNALSDRIEFNEKGNRITVFLTLKE